MSYTETHTVAHNFRCDAHKATLSTDNLTSGLVALWDAMHADCEQGEDGR